MDCIKSIKSSKPKTPFEIIVVDNDEVKDLENDLKKTFPNVRYIPSEKNIGYGAGNNLGAKYAKGNYLFFLNPDTIVKKSCIDRLAEFLARNKKVEIAAPLLLDKNEKPYKLQGTLELTPGRAIFSHSFLNKLFPNNSISRNFWQKGWNKNKDHLVESVPGTAFMISKKLFDQVGGFDENFFLYFEENDLCRRIKELNYLLIIISGARVIHFWEVSTKKRKDINEIFNKSRYYYFKKNYGLLSAVITNFFLNINRYSFFILIILISSLFLSLTDIKDSMTFIGDQGWFYLSAREMIVSGKIPLVGITSSHTWIHQGPLWTYMLTFIFKIFGFNPVNGALLSIYLNLITAYLIYFTGKKMFSSDVGIFAALIYAFSPIAILFARMPYHTSSIPLLTILLIYFVFLWLKGRNYFPWIVFILALLYNFELATFLLAITVFIILAFGLIKKQEFAVKVLKPKVILYSLFAFIVPMMPFVIYDFNHGFPQTLKFMAWLVYKGLSVFGIFSTASGNLVFMLNFILQNYSVFIFPLDKLVSFGIFSLSLVTLLYFLNEDKRFKMPKVIILLFLFVPFIGFIFNKTASSAYLPMFFPVVALLTGLFYAWIISVKKIRIFIALFLLISIILNLNFLISNNYLSNKLMKNKRDAMDKLIRLSNGRKFDIVGSGPGSQFESFTMGYEYLLWWKKHAPVKGSSLTYIIEETPKGIEVRKKE
ncbi:MAG: glycosyltransferase [Actinobacteria bacterium]|nr:glycosyltransferase [Actinomycetota bacterium]